MRVLASLLALAMSAGCGEKNEHPEAADSCDPATMNCTKPPMSGAGPGGNEGGASGGEDTADWTGRVLAFIDDHFRPGLPFPGKALVSATGESGGRVSAPYDGTSFELEGVRKEASNWFMVEPEVDSMLKTITPLDTRTQVASGLDVGLSSAQLVSDIYAISLSSSEPSAERAQIVLTIVDERGRSLEGVEVSLSAELIAYRSGDTWLLDSVRTDDSGMAFLGNVPATAAFSEVNVALLGAVTARVPVRITAGATSVVTAIVSDP